MSDPICEWCKGSGKSPALGGGVCVFCFGEKTAPPIRLNPGQRAGDACQVAFGGCGKVFTTEFVDGISVDDAYLVECPSCGQKTAEVVEKFNGIGQRPQTLPGDEWMNPEGAGGES